MIVALVLGSSACARTIYAVVEFHDRPTSLATSIVILGYTAWSCGGLAAGIALLGQNGGLATLTGALLVATALLMFVGVIGHVARSRLLTLGIMASGVVSLGATFATAALLISSV